MLSSCGRTVMAVSSTGKSASRTSSGHRSVCRLMTSSRTRSTAIDSLWRNATLTTAIRSVKAAHRSTRTALVCGWLPAAGTGAPLRSLMLGTPDADGRLRCLGRASSGLAGPTGILLVGRLTPLARATCPSDDALPTTDTAGVHWCEPTVLVDITYVARTRAGRLRHPVVRGVRDDAVVDAWEDP